MLILLGGACAMGLQVAGEPIAKHPSVIAVNEAAAFILKSPPAMVVSNAASAFLNSPTATAMTDAATTLLMSSPPPLEDVRRFVEDGIVSVSNTLLDWGKEVDHDQVVVAATVPGDHEKHLALAAVAKRDTVKLDGVDYTRSAIARMGVNEDDPAVPLTKH